MKLILILATSLLILSLSTQANSFFKCGNGFVDVGDTKGKIRATCGPALYEDVTSGSDSKILKESWTYNDHGIAKQGWMTILHFERGILTRIESLGRVK